MTALTCQQAVDLLMDYLKRELPPGVAAAVQQHLDDCNPCGQHARFESRFILIVGRSLSKERCPDELRERVRQSLAREGEE